MAQQPFDALGNRVASRISGGEQTENGPRGLRRGARADAAGGGVVVAAAGFSPAAVGILHHADPLGCLLNLRLVVPDADGFKTPQDQEGAIDIVDAPAAEPASVLFLLVVNELDGALDALVLAAVAVGGKRFENAAGDVHGRRIEHGVVVGEGDLFEDHLRVVPIEAGPAAIFALHGEDPFDGALRYVVLIALAGIVHLVQGQQHLAAVVHIGVELIIELEIPATGLRFGILYGPIPFVADLFRQHPVGGL